MRASVYNFKRFHNSNNGLYGLNGLDESEPVRGTGLHGEGTGNGGNDGCKNLQDLFNC